MATKQIQCIPPQGISGITGMLPGCDASWVTWVRTAPQTLGSQLRLRFRHWGILGNMECLPGLVSEKRVHPNQTTQIVGIWYEWFVRHWTSVTTLLRPPDYSHIHPRPQSSLRSRWCAAYPCFAARALRCISHSGTCFLESTGETNHKNVDCWGAYVGGL